MKAWILDKFEGVSNLRLADVDDPSPGANEVLLRVDFAALNPADRYLAEGQYPAKPPLPHILGRDGVGTVVKAGPGVDDFNSGERRLILRGEVGVTRAGTLAQLVVAPVESLVKIPPGWGDEEAAAAPLVYLTAYQALTQWGELPPSIVLVTGASGGVGVASVQLGAALGHDIVALSRSEKKRRRLAELGAKVVLDGEDPQWPEQFKAKLGGRKVDLAIDNIGGPQFPKLVAALGNQGRISVVGQLAGPVPQFSTASLFFRRLRIGGVAVGAYEISESRAAWGAILSLLGRTGAKPLVDQVFPFDQTPRAFERLRAGPMGKVVVRVE